MARNAEAPAVTELIVQKIHRPALVWTLWQGQPCRMPSARLRPATANLEPFLDADARQLLKVQSEAFALQQNVQTAIAKAVPYGAIERPPAAIAHQAAVRTDRLACPPLAQSVDLVEGSVGLESGGGRHHFLEATSRNVALSSIASANSFFSLLLSSSSAFSRRASETSIPPYRAL
jgi:hypothetical protein